MTLSDDLTKLAARAKEAEDRFAAAQKAAHDKLEHDVQSARESLAEEHGSAAQDRRDEQGKGRGVVERRAEELGRPDRLDPSRHRVEEGRARRQDRATKG